PLNGGASIRVTASIGIGVCPEDATAVQDLVAAADAALYEAKRTGRNRVCNLPGKA
ncbi:diguanylate cyclase, partial [Patescibacteria group bacterium]